MINVKLIIAAVIVLFIIGIASYIGIQAKRIDLLKSENIALRVSLESAEDVIVKQNESITALMLQLYQSDSACRKQLEARKTVKAIFKQSVREPFAGSPSRAPLQREELAPTKCDSSTLDKEYYKNQVQPYDIITFEKNTVAVAYLNELFGVYATDGL